MFFISSYFNSGSGRKSEVTAINKNIGIHTEFWLRDLFDFLNFLSAKMEALCSPPSPNVSNNLPVEMTSHTHTHTHTHTNLMFNFGEIPGIMWKITLQ